MPTVPRWPRRPITHSTNLCPVHKAVCLQIGNGTFTDARVTQEIGPTPNANDSRRGYPGHRRTVEGAASFDWFELVDLDLDT